jgi:hypothetical protein
LAAISDQLRRARRGLADGLGEFQVDDHSPFGKLGDISEGGHVDFTHFIRGALSAHRSRAAARSARLVTAPTIPSGTPVV